MADDEVKWEATSSGQTTLLLFFVFFLSFFFKLAFTSRFFFTPQFPPPEIKGFTDVTSCPCAEFLSIWEWNVEWDAILIPEWNQDVRWAL